MYSSTIRTVLLSIVTILCLLPTTAHSQEKKIQTYKGLWEDGTAEYTYYTNPESGDRVLHGKYKWVQTNGSMTDTRQGQYVDGKKEGKWNYRVNGTMRGGGRVIQLENQTEGSYTEGYAEGPWTIKTKGSGTGNGESGGASVVGNANFSFGTFVGKFSYVYKVYGGEDFSVVGQFDDNGWLDGKWEINYLFQISNERISEIREYRHGFLITAIIKNQTTGEVYPKQTNRKIQDALDKLDAGEEIVPFKIDFDDKRGRYKTYKTNLEHDLNEIERIKIGSEYLLKAQSAFEGEEKNIAKYLFGFRLRDMVSTGPQTTISDTIRFFKLRYDAAQQFENDKKYEMAEAEYTKILKFSHPNMFYVYADRAQARGNLNQNKEALEDIDQYIRIYPDSSGGHAQRGWYLFMNGRYSESVEASKRAQSLGDNGCWIQRNISLAHLCNGDIQLATTQYTNVKQDSAKECVDDAIADLKMTIDRGIKVAEATAVLKNVFSITYSPKPK